MDAHFFSHVMLWIVGGIAAAGGLGAIAALFSMGRQGYRKP